MSSVVMTNIIGCNTCGTIKRHGPGSTISWVLCKNCQYTAFYSYPSFTPYITSRYAKPPDININGPVGRELFWDSPDVYHLFNYMPENNREYCYYSINGYRVFRSTSSVSSISADSDSS